MKKTLLAMVAGVAFAGSAHAAKVPSEDRAQHSSLCKEQWTKRGQLNGRMFEFCMNMQHEGYLKLRAEIAKYASQPWIQDVLDAAIQEWTKRGVRDDNMTAFELHRQTDAFEDIEYAKRQPGFNADKFARCAAKWRLDFTMVNHCYREG